MLGRGLKECMIALLVFVCCVIAAPFLLLVVLPILVVYRRCTVNVGFDITSYQRVAAYDARERVSVKRKFKPTLSGNGMVLVKIKAAGVNPVDAKCVVGDKFPESWMDFWFRRFSNCVIGFDFSGIVVEAPTSSQFRTGDEVFGLNYQYAPIGFGKFGGTICEYALVPEDQMWRKPKSLGFIEAAALPLVGVTSLQALEQHGLQRGQNVLIVGASGGVGHVLTQIASRIGTNVTAVCSGRNAAFVRDCGASEVIDYRTENVQQAMQKRVAEIGRMDIIYDTVSSADSRDKSANYAFMLRRASPPIVKSQGSTDGGNVDAHNYVVFGGRTVDWWRALVLRLLHISLFPSGFELFWIRMPNSQRYLRTLCRLCDEDGMKPKVMHAFPFSKSGVGRAFRMLHPPKGEHRSASGKIVIDVSVASNSAASGDGNGMSKKES